MKVYDNEQSVAESIRANTQFALGAHCEFKQPTKVESSITDDPHPDMMYGSAILASTVMNLNDEVLIPEHIWPALETTIDTPFNNRHVRNKIIGHILDYRALNEDGEKITQPEDYFDVEVDFVVYKSIFPEIAEKIAEGFENQTQFVSLEGEINDFDYALIDADGMKIVSRNKDTSFLTKYLRVYGGSGTWRDYKVARVLKEFRFTGMGNVDDPANPGSVYTRIENFEVVEPEEILNQRRDQMFENLEDALKHIEKLEAQKTEQDEKISKLEAAIEEKTEINEKTLAERLDVEKSKVKASEQAAAKAKEQADKVAEELKAAQAKLAEKEAELAEINAEKVLQDRLAKLDDIGITYDDDDKERFANMSEESFEAVVEYSKRAVDANKSEEAEEGEDVEASDNSDVEVEAEETEEEGVEASEGDVEDEDDTSVVASKLISAVRASRNKKNK